MFSLALMPVTAKETFMQFPRTYTNTKACKAKSLPSIKSSSRSPKITVPKNKTIYKGKNESEQLKKVQDEQVFAPDDEMCSDMADYLFVEKEFEEDYVLLP